MFVHDTEILIRVHPGGVYFMGGDGATGKSYLFSLLKARNQIVGEQDKVLLLTCDADLTKEDYIKRIKRFKGNLIFADRFSLYGDRELLQLLVASGATALVDEKDYYVINHVAGIRLSEIILSEKRIEVVEL